MSSGVGPDTGSSCLSKAVSSPCGRYNRQNKKLGTGTYKKVYLGIDTVDGKDVAWSSINLRILSKADEVRVMDEAQLLPKLEHPHILRIHHSWINEEKGELCLITAIAAKTLKEHIHILHPTKPAILKKCCRQILSALVYLHEENKPSIIHRDLKCDNIFVDGPTGDIKIGDFGLAKPQQSAASTMIGTPGFMAPELFDEHYNELVDIYAFGMSVLEMATDEYPYVECNNVIMSLLKKGAENVRPNALKKVTDPALRQFIEMCLEHRDTRPSARALLEQTVWPLFVDESAAAAAAAAAGAKATANERRQQQVDGRPRVSESSKPRASESSKPRASESNPDNLAGKASGKAPSKSTTPVATLTSSSLPRVEEVKVETVPGESIVHLTITAILHDPDCPTGRAHVEVVRDYDFALKKSTDKSLANWLITNSLVFRGLGDAFQKHLVKHICRHLEPVREAWRESSVKKDTDDLSSFLQTIGIKKEITKILVEQEINLEDIPGLKDEDWQTMGIKMGPRTRLKNLLKKHKNENGGYSTSPTISTTAHSRRASILSNTNIKTGSLSSNDSTPCSTPIGGTPAMVFPPRPTVSVPVGRAGSPAISPPHNLSPRTIHANMIPIPTTTNAPLNSVTSIPSATSRISTTITTASTASSSNSSTISPIAPPAATAATATTSPTNSATTSTIATTTTNAAIKHATTTATKPATNKPVTKPATNTATRPAHSPPANSPTSPARSSPPSTLTQPPVGHHVVLEGRKAKQRSSSDMDLCLSSSRPNFSLKKTTKTMDEMRRQGETPKSTKSGKTTVDPLDAMMQASLFNL